MGNRCESPLRNQRISPCSCPCILARDAGRRRGAGRHASRQLCRTAGAGCTVGSPLKVVGTRSSTASSAESIATRRTARSILQAARKVIEDATQIPSDFQFCVGRKSLKTQARDAAFATDAKKFLPYLSPKESIHIYECMTPNVAISAYRRSVHPALASARESALAPGPV
jgi:hypothetical protein